MSELIAYNSERIYWAVEQVEQEGGDIDTLHLDDNLFYLKSESDKVIAELKEKLKEQTSLAEEGWKESGTYHTSYAEAVKELYEKNKELRHQKYKRCLGMAQEWRNYASFCGMQSSCHNHRGFGKTAEKYTWKECHAWKCVKRYEELAEKFKEVK